MYTMFRRTWKVIVKPFQSNVLTRPSRAAHHWCLAQARSLRTRVYILIAVVPKQFVMSRPKGLTRGGNYISHEIRNS